MGGDRMFPTVFGCQDSCQSLRRWDELTRVRTHSFAPVRSLGCSAYLVKEKSEDGFEPVKLPKNFRGGKEEIPL